MSEDYDGEEKRKTERRGMFHVDCDDHLHRVVHEKVGECKLEMYADIHALRSDMSKVHTRLDTLTGDVHILSVTMRDIANNSQSIAASLDKMSDMYEAYRSVVGFGRAVTWMKDNLVMLILLLALILYAGGKIETNVLFGWLL